MASASYQPINRPPAGAVTRTAWLVPVLLVALALGVVAGAGWWGYERQIDGLTTAAAAASGTLPGPAKVAADTTAARSGSAAAEPAASPTPRPAGVRMPDAAASAAALSWPLWEFRLRQPIPPRDPPLTPVRWRLVGSTLSGGKWAIIVLRQGKTDPEYFSVGQELPGGYRIAAISEEDVTLVQGKRTMVLSYIGSR